MYEPSLYVLEDFSNDPYQDEQPQREVKVCDRCQALILDGYPRDSGLPHYDLHMKWHEEHDRLLRGVVDALTGVRVVQSDDDTDTPDQEPEWRHYQ